MKLRNLLFLLLSSALLSSASMYADFSAGFYYEHSYVSESNALQYIPVNMSQVSSVDTMIDFSLDLEETTATMQSEEDSDDGDFYIEDGEHNTYVTWDSSTNTGVYTIPAGSKFKSNFRVQVNNDSLQNLGAHKQIVFNIDKVYNETYTYDVPGGKHTLYIVDDDPFYAKLSQSHYHASEDEAEMIITIDIPYKSYGIDFPYIIRFDGEAKPYDLDASEYIDDDATYYEGVISSTAGDTSVIIYLPIKDDTEIEVDENGDKLAEDFTIQLLQPYKTIDDEDTDDEEDDDEDLAPLFFSNAISTCTISDNADKSFGFALVNFPEEVTTQNFYNDIYKTGDYEYSIRESDDFEMEIFVRLEATALSDLEIPFTVSYSGDAETPPYTLYSSTLNSEYDEDDEDSNYYEELEENVILIEEGQVAGHIMLIMNDDDSSEGDKRLTISLDEVVDTDYNINLNDAHTLNLDFVDDNDGDEKLKFAVLDSEGLYEFTDSMTIPSSNYIFNDFSYYQTSFYVINEWPVGGEILFDVEIIDVGNATSYTSEIASNDGEWDYYLSSSSGQVTEEPITVSLASDSIGVSLSIQTGTVETDPLSEPRYFTIQMSNARLIDEDDGTETSVEIDPDYDSFTISMVNLGDFDISNKFTEYQEDEGCFSDVIIEDVIFEEETGLFNVIYSFSSEFSEEELESFTGYKTLKLMLDTSGVDDLELSDDQDVAKQQILDAGNSFEYVPSLVSGTYEKSFAELKQHYAVESHLVWKYFNDYVYEKVVEVDESKQEIGEPINVDVYQYKPYIMYALNFPVLDENLEESREDFPSLAEKLTFTFEFKSNGITDPNVFKETYKDKLDNVQIYFSRETSLDTSTYTSFNTIYRLVDCADGGVALKIDTSSSDYVRIQYMTEDGDWINSQPSEINTPGSLLFWKDIGLPKTNVHPSEVKMRMYRVINLQ